jgi:hypothetical protein
MSTRQTERTSSHSPASGSGEPHRRAIGRDEPPISVDKALLRLGVSIGVVGVVLQVVMDRLHPHQVDPNNSAAVFREYAESHDWTWVHIGQFTGTLFIILGLIALARSLARQAGIAGALGIIGTVTAVLVTSVFAVQMAVDGVALKAAIDAWAGASAADQQSAFQLAETVRWTEKGLGGFFQMLEGATLFTLGLSIAIGRRYPRWLGWVGMVAGIATIAGGTVTAHTGFSAVAGAFLTPAIALLAIFLVGIFIAMWRRSATR